MQHTIKQELELNAQFGANNYKPLPVAIATGKGVWVEDTEGNKYMDMLAAYSSLNQGHRHPKIISALKKQADRLTISSRAFHNDKMGLFLEKLCTMTGFEKALLMNTGAEAVETALKAVRKYAFIKKGITDGEIIACSNNFHGRTISVVSFSTEPQYRDGFGPFTPGFKTAEYGSIKDMRSLVTDKTIAVILEPIQGEAGVVVPPKNYLKQVRELCDEKGLLMICDEIQTGFGRSGKMFAFEHAEIKPDLVVVGKALGGGVYPVSACLTSSEIMSVFNPGDHGSTFGGNPLGAAVGIAALEVLEKEKLVDKSRKFGKYFMGLLKTLTNPNIKEVRGKGLMIGLEMTEAARPYCEKLMQKGLLCKETHTYTIRFTPPLVITKAEIDKAFAIIKEIIG